MREANREKALQDLLYRSEYLAGLVSQVAQLEAKPDEEDLSRALAHSPVPRLVQTSAGLLSSRRDSSAGQAGSPGSSPLVFMGPRLCQGGGKAAALAAEAEAGTMERVCGTLHPVTAAGQGRQVALMRGRFAWEDTCKGVNSMLETCPGQHPEAARGASAVADVQVMSPVLQKVPPVRGIPVGAIQDDHVQQEKAAAEAGIAFDTTGAHARFARFFWRSGLAQGPSMSRFLRTDGGGEIATDRFSLVEGGSKVVRGEGLDLFRSRALVIGNLPAQVVAEGHYFELRVAALFKTPGPPDRPRGPGGRTEGLIIGFTSTPPSEVGNAPAADCIPNAWVVSTSGTFTITGSGLPLTARSSPTSERISGEPPSWHRSRFGGRLPANRSPFSPLSSPPMSRAATPGGVPQTLARMRRRIPWTAALEEGHTIGMLITPLGHIVVAVNGERQLVIDDAAVPVDASMYPVVEVYNHIKTAQVVPGARPPKR